MQICSEMCTDPNINMDGSPWAPTQKCLFEGKHYMNGVVIMQLDCELCTLDPQ